MQCAARWMQLDIIILSEVRKKKTNTIWHHLYVESDIWHMHAQSLQSCPILCNLPGSSVPEILQARILEWVAMLYSRGSSPPRDQICISCIAGGFFTHWATWEDQWQLTGLWKYLHIPWTTIEIKDLPQFESLCFGIPKVSIRFIKSLYCYLNRFLLLKTDFQSSRHYTHYDYTKSPTFYGR